MQNKKSSDNLIHAVLALKTATVIVGSDNMEDEKNQASSHANTLEKKFHEGNKKLNHRPNHSFSIHQPRHLQQRGCKESRSETANRKDQSSQQHRPVYKIFP